MSEKKRVFIIGTVWPEVTSSAAGLRDENLIHSFLTSNWSVFYSSPSQENSFSESLKSRGIRIFSCPANDSKFDAIIRDINPDVVLFDRFLMEEQFSFRVKQVVPQALRVVDTQDLHFLRRARVRALESGVELDKVFKNEIVLESEDLLRECASIYRSDLTLVLSPFEIKLLIEKFKIPSELLFYLPFSYDEEKVIQKNIFSETQNFFFIGNFRHAPNWDAVKWLNREIWPEIRNQLPKAEVHVFGSYPPKEAMALDNPKTGFRVFGPLQNHLEKMSKYRVNLAPLRVGAGIKGKITDGWSVGLPVVTTPIGAEGLFDKIEDFGGLIAKNIQEFILNSVELYKNESLWNKSQKIGQDFLFDKMNTHTNTSQFISKIEESLEQKLAAGDHSVIQSILWHEQFQRTKYFSRWIEEKNKKN